MENVPKEGNVRDLDDWTKDVFSISKRYVMVVPNSLRNGPEEDRLISHVKEFIEIRSYDWEYVGSPILPNNGNNEFLGSFLFFTMDSVDIQELSDMFPLTYHARYEGLSKGKYADFVELCVIYSIDEVKAVTLIATEEMPNLTIKSHGVRYNTATPGNVKNIQASARRYKFEKYG